MKRQASWLLEGHWWLKALILSSCISKVSFFQPQHPRCPHHLWPWVPWLESWKLGLSHFVLVSCFNIVWDGWIKKTIVCYWKAMKDRSINHFSCVAYFKPWCFHCFHIIYFNHLWYFITIVWCLFFWGYNTLIFWIMKGKKNCERKISWF